MREFRSVRKARRSLKPGSWLAVLMLGVGIVSPVASLDAQLAAHEVLAGTESAPSAFSDESGDPDEGSDPEHRSWVVFSPPSGLYEGPVVVTLETDLRGDFELRYTTDGETPTVSSALYQTPLVPEEDVVLRVGGFRDGRLVTSIASASYFLETDFELPVMSLIMEPEDYRTVHLGGDARGRASERPAHLEVFEDRRLVAGTGCGLRLHGGTSRNGDFETKKSYRCYFRGEYGDKKLSYPIIPDTFVDRFKQFVLRAGFNDSFRGSASAAYLRDQVIRDLHEDMGMLVSHGSWVNLFVNMKWRGVFNVVERLDEKFLRSYTGEGQWDVIKTGNDVQAGDATEWMRLHEFMVESDLSDDHLYQEATRLLDLENFTSYMLVNIWAQNHDWPHNNWYAARPRRPDGRWIFLCWDGEFGIGLIPEGHEADTFEFIFSREGYLREILESLLANASYREYFIEEADRQRFGALRPARVLAHLRRLRDLVDADMDREAAAFGRDRSEWLSNIGDCERFARYRGPYFFDSIAASDRFDFPTVTTPRILSVSPTSLLNTGEQTVTLSGVRLTSRTEFYFNGVRAMEVDRRVGAQFQVRVPFDLSLEGTVTLTAVHPRTRASSEAPELVTMVFPRPVPLRVDPVSGSAGGGERVRIQGTGFRPGVEVWFGGAPALRVRLLDAAGRDEGPQVLEVVTPAGRGATPIFVINHVAGGTVPAETSWFFHYREEGFIRGDLDGDGQVEITDALRLLSRLAGDADLECESASDVDDSGVVDATDGIYLLGYLFGGRGAPAAPFPVCGLDPTPDRLGCLGRSFCAG